MLHLRLSLTQFRNFKIVYRRYAGLYFCICVDVSDNNLAYLEAIHNFVEVSVTVVGWTMSSLLLVVGGCFRA